jgi:hypothetical protein
VGTCVMSLRILHRPFPDIAIHAPLPRLNRTHHVPWRPGGHASLKSFFLRLLPNRTGHTRTFFWDGLMWLMEIPPYLETNIARCAQLCLYFCIH